MTIQNITVKTLNEKALHDAAIALNAEIFKEFIPDIIVGIPSGGYIVAEIMAKEAAHKPELAAISRRRTSTDTKRKIKGLKSALRLLPYAITDRMRILEHKKLMAKPKNNRNEFAPDDNEVALFRRLLKEKPTAKILIVDDAVDSGSTMKAVFDLLQKEAPTNNIKTAAITVTTDNPVIQPDYTLYSHVLCRMPWSFDFRN